MPFYFTVIIYDDVIKWFHVGISKETHKVAKGCYPNRHGGFY